MAHLDPRLVERLPPPVQGALWMSLSTLCFAITAVLIRYIADDVHPFEIAFFRNVFGILYMAPWMVAVGWAGLKTRRLGLYLARSLCATGAQLSWFTGVTLMPLAAATALNFTSPLFSTLGAGLFLGEPVGMRRALAVAVGFGGMLIMLRPGFAIIALPAFVVLLASLFQACTQLEAKVLTRTEPPSQIVLYLALMMTPTTGLAALFVWTAPSIDTLFWLFVMGATSTAGQQAMMRAFRAADASAVVPFIYTRLLFTALLAYVLYDEVPDLWTWVGSAVIFVATLYSGGETARRPAASPAEGS